MVRMVRGAAAVAFCAVAVWLWLPGRNQAGNPRMETLLSGCRLGGGIEMRLYEGGGGATVAHWYSLTHNPSGLRPERQVVYTYQSPVLSRLTCAANSASVDAGDRQLSWSADQLIALRGDPLQFYRGERSAMSGVQPLRMVELLAGAGALAISLLIAAGLVRDQRARALLAT